MIARATKSATVTSIMLIDPVISARTSSIGVIPIVARIVALADMYDAMTSERCYKQASGHEEAKEAIIKERGGQFDPNVVDSFLEHEDAWLAIHNKFRD